ncbi:PAS domain-containing protein [Roseovarius aestuarii]|nr:PAS domain-containing protein [Roseovarius aestuarii]
MTNESDAPDRPMIQIAHSTLDNMPCNSSDIDDFLSYWTRMRCNGDVPRRSDIDPRGIEALLSNAFIVERIAPGLARFRIAGSHLSDLMGMEVRGMPLSAFFNSDHRGALSDALVEVFDAPATLHMDLSSKGRAGAPAMSGQLIVLPLRSDLGDVSRALGCLVTKGTPGRGPRRFDIDEVRITKIDLGQGITLDMPKSTAPAPTGFAEDRAAPLSKAERPYLRLVKNT